MAVDRKQLVGWVLTVEVKEHDFPVVPSNRGILVPRMATEPSQVPFFEQATIELLIRKPVLREKSTRSLLAGD
jgi:hypothetical protein